jgi:hypothetical protein
MKRGPGLTTAQEQPRQVSSSRRCRAGLVDELELHLVPLLLGDGERLLDKLVSTVPSFEQVRAVVGTGVTHLKYRVVR